MKLAGLLAELETRVAKSGGRYLWYLCPGQLPVGRPRPQYTLREKCGLGFGWVRVIRSLAVSAIRPNPNSALLNVEQHSVAHNPVHDHDQRIPSR